jgi:hyaluronan synthase
LSFHRRPRCVPVPPAAAEDTRPKLAPFRPLDEATAALSERAARALPLRLAMRVLQVACFVYGSFLLYWIYLAKDMSLSLFFRDPVFYTYSLLVTVYVCSRFLLAPFYRPTPDRGYRPTVSIVIPAFNEGEVVRATIDACYTGEYPAEQVEVVVVDDGSSDDTWEHILVARERHPSLLAIQFSHNRGKRAAMAEGIRHSSGDVLVFIDSDSVIEPDGLAMITADFADPRVGGVVGCAEVLNKTANWITRMQQVRYYVAFHVIKGSESLFGAVTCASGCFSAYRRDALLAILDRWEHQRFLGKPATYGDDRALTNFILRDWRVVYQANARSHTLAPDTLRRFLVQQLRWKKSWLRESIQLGRLIWRKHPIAAALAYMGVFFPWVAPVVVVHSLYYRAAFEGSPLFYVMGAYVMALLYSLYYAVRRRSPLWWHGISFIGIYTAFLVWQTYYAVATLRNTSWGTRASAHHEEEGETLVLPTHDETTPEPDAPVWDSELLELPRFLREKGSVAA